MPVRWSRHLLGLFFLSFPLLNVGVSIGGYPFSIPFVLLVAYDASVLLRWRVGVQSNTLFAASMFLIWSVGVTAPRIPFEDFGPSLMVLFLVWVPFWALPPGTDRSGIARLWFVRGLYLCLAICAYQMVSRFVGIPALESLSPTIVDQRTTSVASFARLNGLMVEPSYLALYLCFGYIGVDCLLLPGRRKRVILGITLLMLAGTFSMAGIAVLGTYLAFKYVFLLRYKRWLVRVGLVILVMAILLLLFGPWLVQTAPGAYLCERTQLVQSWLLNPKSGQTGSEAVRLGAVMLGFQYPGIGNPIWGEGYANSERWVAAHSSTNGQIHNIYAYVIISLGLVGLGLYLFFLTSLRLPLLGSPQMLRAAFIAWLVTAVATGHFIHYYYWGFLLPIYLVRNDRPKEAICDSP